MYWSSGRGSIAKGTDQQGVVPEGTNVDNSSGKKLEAGQGVFVMKTNFKLVRG